MIAVINITIEDCEKNEFWQKRSQNTQSFQRAADCPGGDRQGLCSSTSRSRHPHSTAMILSPMNATRGGRAGAPRSNKPCALMRRSRR